MKKAISAALVTLALACEAMGTTVDAWLNGMGVSTNVDGIMLTLEFANATVVAGERIGTRMVVSNASKSLHQLDWGTGVPGRDTKIGQFVVEDDEGNPVSRTFWAPPPSGMWIGGSEGTRVEPGDAIAFPGDIVKTYSLTNPGIYRVKAVATVGKRAGVGEMIVETPTVLLTVLGRPPGMPPPQPLHTASEIENILKDRTPPLAMTVTHPKPERPPEVPRVAPREAQTPLPQGVPHQTVNGPVAAKKESPILSSRGVLFALIAVLLSGALVVYLVWSRRKHGHP